MVSAPSITHGWSVLSVVVVGARRERDAGVFFQNFFAFCYAKTGGKEEDEQCRSKRHRSDLPLFFLFYIYMKRRRFG